MKNLLFLSILSATSLVSPEHLPSKPILYVKNSCFWCKKVLYEVENLEKLVEIRDILEGENRKELIEIGGKGQIPCLIVDGNAMYESSTIITYLTHLESPN